MRIKDEVIAVFQLFVIAPLYCCAVVMMFHWGVHGLIKVFLAGDWKYGAGELVAAGICYAITKRIDR